MLFVRACKMLLIPAVMLSAALVATPTFASRTHRSATSGHSKLARKKAVSHQLHGQREIDPQRAREIQTALIREHYLSGEPTGQWDADSQAAMTKYQSDQGWQTKLTPDSRALIKLGLGPNQESSAMAPGNQASMPTGTSPQASAVRSSALLGSQSLAQ